MVLPEDSAMLPEEVLGLLLALQGAQAAPLLRRLQGAGRMVLPKDWGMLPEEVLGLFRVLQGALRRVLESGILGRSSVFSIVSEAAAALPFDLGGARGCTALSVLCEVFCCVRPVQHGRDATFVVWALRVPWTGREQASPAQDRESLPLDPRRAS